MSSPSSIPPWWIGIAGVLIGFLLGEGARYARYRWEIWRNRRIIRTELQTILAQLPQKQDILRQAIEHFKQQRFMPTLSVRSVTTGYRAVLNDLYPHLTLIERNCLHVIYERLRVADEQMDGLEESFIRAVKDKIIGDPWATYTGRLEELVESYKVVDYLVRAYIANQSVDVFGNRGQS